MPNEKKTNGRNEIKKKLLSVIIVYSAKFCAPHRFLSLSRPLAIALQLGNAFLFVIINKLMILNYNLVQVHIILRFYLQAFTLIPLRFTIAAAGEERE